MKYLRSLQLCVLWVVLTVPNSAMAYIPLHMNTLQEERQPETDGFLGPDVAICAGDTLRIEAPLGISYLWSTGQTTRFIDVMPVVSTDYWVRMINLQGLEQRDTLAVTVHPKPTVAIQPAISTLLPGEAVLLTASGASAYTWSDGSTGPQFFAAPALPENLYTVTGSNIHGCSASAQATVFVNYTTQAAFANTNTCIGDTTFFTSKILTNDTIQLIEWDLDHDLMFDDGIGEQVFYHFQEAGEWLVGLRVTTKYAPQPHVVYQPVVVGDVPVVEIDFLSSCIATPIQFEGHAFAAFGSIESWNWDFDNGQTASTQNPIATFGQAGQYNIQLEVTTTAACKAVATKTFTTSARPALSISFGDGTPIEQLPLVLFKNDTITLKANGIFDSVIWNRQVKNVLFKVTRAGTYSAVSYRDGCSSNSLSIGVTQSEFPYDPSLKIPNFLTPNGDGYNDVWELPMLNSLRPAKVTIYSRAGLQVMQSTDYQNDWKGQYNNNPLPEGSYFYVVEGSGGEVFKGTITLLR